MASIPGLIFQGGGFWRGEDGGGCGHPEEPQQRGQQRLCGAQRPGGEDISPRKQEDSASCAQQTQVMVRSFLQNRDSVNKDN